ncbi:hypothetical protein [Leptolyngbya sp. Heron Island J]|nr:hypothetical protein [Leptolyngbya sp. Heron Island J]
MDRPASGQLSDSSTAIEVAVNRAVGRELLEDSVETTGISIGS